MAHSSELAVSRISDTWSNSVTKFSFSSQNNRVGGTLFYGLELRQKLLCYLYITIRKFKLHKFLLVSIIILYVLNRVPSVGISLYLIK